jgi:hypothetical protein
VTICVGVLSTEDRTDFKYSLHITTEDHLLVKLRRLSKACFLSEVVKAENICTTL